MHDIKKIDYSKDDIISYIDKKMLDYSFDIEIINSQFSVLGIMLLS